MHESDDYITILSSRAPMQPRPLGFGVISVRGVRTVMQKLYDHDTRAPSCYSRYKAVGFRKHAPKQTINGVRLRLRLGLP